MRVVAVLGVLVVACTVNADLIKRRGGAAAPMAQRKLKQTSRKDIIRRSKRPARRAIVSPGPPPSQVNEYSYQNTVNNQHSEDPDATQTRSATYSQNDVITYCAENAPGQYNELQVRYSNSEDIWHCDYFSSQQSPANYVADPDAEVVYIYTAAS